MNLTSIAITPFAQGIIKVDCDRDETTNALKTRSSMVVSARHHAVGEGSLSAPKLVEHPIQEHLMALEANKAADAIVEIPVKLFFNKSVNSIAIQYKAYDQETGVRISANVTGHFGAS
ncbi:hypothetical protein [Hydrogenophaga laconesensis]|uniref:Uncharacterized protein n=1 Tax=Hydrogenophaga laconesensis TaxID=1805971 RepID=A0ABU1VJN1_9BURK|nr:hypothetical protein [Hydrogenophaga laconesensis]MDR7097535.1 hypothetical protein [Hydrogenophaga laconesensis]